MVTPAVLENESNCQFGMENKPKNIINNDTKRISFKRNIIVL